MTVQRVELVKPVEVEVQSLLGPCYSEHNVDVGLQKFNIRHYGDTKTPAVMK